jgi:DNA-binding CsgD family transcriptional regulator
VHFAKKQTIGKTIFTARELDVLSCILHSRGAKKIATILSLSPRTVENHIQNIMRKMGCNSQESIIDFMERSSELNLFKKHYLNLLIYNNFQQELENIAYLSKKSDIVCYINCSENNVLSAAIIKHLKCVGIKIKVNLSNVSDTENVLYILSNELIDKFPAEQIIDNYHNKKQKVILIILDEKIKNFIQNEFNDFNIVDFSKIDNYYQSMFDLLRKLLPKINLESFIAKFEKLRNNIINPKLDIAFDILQNTVINTSNNIETSINSEQKDPEQRKTPLNKKLILFSFAICVSISVIFIMHKYTNYVQQTTIKQSVKTLQNKNKIQDESVKNKVT